MKFCSSLIVFLFIVHSAFSQTSASTAIASAKELAEKGNFKQAIAVLDKLLSTQNSSSAIIYKTACQFGLKESEEAMNTLAHGIEVMPDSFDLYMFRGNIFEQNTMYKAAINDYTKGFEKSPNDSLSCEFMVAIGAVKHRIQDYSGAYQDLRLSIKFDSTNIHPYVMIAPVCTKLGKDDEAIMYLQKAISLKPSDKGIYINLGFCYQKMNQHKLAIEAFNKVLELDPNEALGYSNRAFSKCELGDLKGATVDINKSIKLLETNSYAYKIRAIIEFKEGKTKAGCDDITKSMELGYVTRYGNEVIELQEKYCK